MIVVGFNKGEIHVYDAFKKDSSQCFNSAVSVLFLKYYFDWKHLFESNFLRKQSIKLEQRVLNGFQIVKIYF